MKVAPIRPLFSVSTTVGKSVKPLGFEPGGGAPKGRRFAIPSKRSNQSLIIRRPSNQNLIIRRLMKEQGVDPA